MIEFGIQLGGPAAEEMGDRHDYYRVAPQAERRVGR